VTSTPSNLLIKIGRDEPLINGEYFEKILNDSFVWTLETGEV
jgi:hypothetical protein